MQKRTLFVSSALAAGLLAAATAGAMGARGHGSYEHGFGSPGPHPAVFGAPGMHGGPHLHGLTRKLNLSEEQRDQIFKLMHAQRPAVREKMKELRKGREELYQATIAKDYDAGRVRELADAQARVIADLIVMRTETFNKVYALLTPGQQEKARELKDRGRHGPRGE
jgi:protein CpxP